MELELYKRGRDFRINLFNISTFGIGITKRPGGKMNF